MDITIWKGTKKPGARMENPQEEKPVRVANACSRLCQLALGAMLPVRSPHP